MLLISIVKKYICIGVRHLEQEKKDNFVGFIHSCHFDMELTNKYKYVRKTSSGDQVEIMLRFLSNFYQIVWQNQEIILMNL